MLVLHLMMPVLPMILVSLKIFNFFIKDILCYDFLIGNLSIWLLSFRKALGQEKGVIKSLRNKNNTVLFINTKTFIMVNKIICYYSIQLSKTGRQTHPPPFPQNRKYNNSGIIIQLNPKKATRVKTKSEANFAVSLT